MSETRGRLLQLLSLLQQRTRWPGPELAERLAITPRTLRRDIDRLRTLGYPVDAAPGASGGYQLQIGASMPPLLLDDDETTAVAIALGLAASGVVAGVEESALHALAKLDRLLPAHVRARVDAVRATTLQMSGSDPVVADVLIAIARAASEHIRLRLTYVDRDGRESDRRVDPYRLVSTGRRWYLVAFDVDRDDWRTFRADRIVAATATGHGFTMPDPPDAVELVSRAMGVAPYRYVAEVIVYTSPEHLATIVPPTVGTIERHPDGALLHVGSDDLRNLAGHLVGMDVPFRAVGPPELREMLQRMGTRLAAQHAEP